MLHLTTEVGKPGRHERERRHFPDLPKKASTQIYHPTGRRYLPHYYGKSEDWKPHGSYQEPQYTSPGPDWSSRLRWIPHPENPQYPAAEIWPENWCSIRNFPWTYKTTVNDQRLKPIEMKKGKRCTFGGFHRATLQSTNEVIDFTVKRSVSDIEKRNGIISAAPGDKVYQAVEYSDYFHRGGSTRPVPNFSGNNQRPVDTFIPLERLPTLPRESFKVLERKRQSQEEVKVVESLEKWKPATPLMNTST